MGRVSISSASWRWQRHHRHDQSTEQSRRQHSRQEWLVAGGRRRWPSATFPLVTEHPARGQRSDNLQRLSYWWATERSASRSPSVDQLIDDAVCLHFGLSGPTVRSGPAVWRSCLDSGMAAIVAERTMFSERRAAVAGQGPTLATLPVNRPTWPPTQCWVANNDNASAHRSRNSSERRHPATTVITNSKTCILDDISVGQF